MTFPDDALGMIDYSSFAVYGYDQRLEVSVLKLKYLLFALE